MFSWRNVSLNGTDAYPNAAGTSLSCRSPAWPHTTASASITLTADAPISMSEANPGCSSHDEQQGLVVTGDIMVSWQAGAVSFKDVSAAVTTSMDAVGFSLTRTISVVGRVVVHLMSRATLVEVVTFETGVADAVVSVPVSRLMNLAGRSLSDDAVHFVVSFSLEAVSPGAAIGEMATIKVAVCGSGAYVMTLDTLTPKCLACPRGSFASGADVAQCSTCPKDTCVEYAGVWPLSGVMTFVPPCVRSGSPTYRYASSPRTTNCTSCPPNAFTLSDGARSLRDCRCPPEGFYRSVQGTCEPCADGDPQATCVVYDANDEQVLAPGWWLSADALALSDNGAANISGMVQPLKCPDQSHSPCEGGSTVGVCATGYEGYLCTGCVTG